MTSFLLTKEEIETFRPVVLPVHPSPARGRQWGVKLRVKEERRRCGGRTPGSGPTRGRRRGRWIEWRPLYSVGGRQTELNRPLERRSTPRQRRISQNRTALQLLRHSETPGHRIATREDWLLRPPKIPRTLKHPTFDARTLLKGGRKPPEQERTVCREGNEQLCVPQENGKHVAAPSSLPPSLFPPGEHPNGGRWRERGESKRAAEREADKGRRS
jgi:hypothetical protein